MSQALFLLLNPCLIFNLADSAEKSQRRKVQQCRWRGGLGSVH